MMGFLSLWFCFLLLSFKSLFYIYFLFIFLSVLTLRYKHFEIYFWWKALSASEYTARTSLFVKSFQVIFFSFLFRFTNFKFINMKFQKKDIFSCFICMYKLHRKVNFRLKLMIVPMILIVFDPKERVFLGPFLIFIPKIALSTIRYSSKFSKIVVTSTEVDQLSYLQFIQYPRGSVHVAMIYTQSNRCTLVHQIPNWVVLLILQTD